MRPSNLKEVASSVVNGMSRSINRSAQSIEEEFREGSRKGGRYQDALAKYSRDNNVYYPMGLSEDGAYDTLSYHAEADDKTLDDLISEIEGNAPNIYDEFASERLESMKGHKGSRNGSRKGMDIDGFFPEVARKHGLDTVKAIKVRHEMDEEGILPDTPEFAELCHKYGVELKPMLDAIDEFVEEYLS